MKNKVKEFPTLADLLSKTKDELSYSLHCSLPGTIVDFDAANQSATIYINLKNVAGDSEVEYPQLILCPVFIYSGGTGVMTLPVAKGDTCLVMFSDRDIDNWWSTGNVVTPNTSRAHDLQDGFALIGFRSKANALAGYSTTNAEIKNLGSKLSIGVNIDETSSGGTHVRLANKFRVENSASTLLTVLTKITDALSALDGVKVGSSAASAISDAVTEIGKLIE